MFGYSEEMIKKIADKMKDEMIDEEKKIEGKRKKEKERKNEYYEPRELPTKEDISKDEAFGYKFLNEKLLMTLFK